MSKFLAAIMGGICLSIQPELSRAVCGAKDEWDDNSGGGSNPSTGIAGLDIGSIIMMQRMQSFGAALAAIAPKFTQASKVLKDLTDNSSSAPRLERGLKNATVGAIATVTDTMIDTTSLTTTAPDVQVFVRRLGVGLDVFNDVFGDFIQAVDVFSQSMATEQINKLIGQGKDQTLALVLSGGLTAPLARETEALVSSK